MSDNYEKAWKSLIRRFGGALDGVEWSVEEGSSQAARDVKIYREIETMINEIARDYDVEEIWY